MNKIRLFVDHTLGEAQSVPLNKDQAHYIFSVMRKSIGETILIFDGNNGEWEASIEEISKKSGVLFCIKQTKPQIMPPDLWLFFSPLKKVRTDFIVEKATELGEVEAMYNMGRFYDEGPIGVNPVGVKLNKKKAMHFYRMAADRGCALSQTCLAEMLCESGNIKEAFRYIQLSAEQGFTVGELSLGECYWRGNGVKIDIDEARHWFMRAAGKGNERAKEHLAQIFRFLEESSDGDSDASWATVDE